MQTLLSTIFMPESKNYKFISPALEAGNHSLATEVTDRVVVITYESLCNLTQLACLMSLQTVH